MRFRDNVLAFILVDILEQGNKTRLENALSAFVGLTFEETTLSELGI